MEFTVLKELALTKAKKTFRENLFKITENDPIIVLCNTSGLSYDTFFELLSFVLNHSEKVPKYDNLENCPYRINLVNGSEFDPYIEIFLDSGSLRTLEESEIPITAKNFTCFFNRCCNIGLSLRQAIGEAIIIIKEFIPEIAPIHAYDSYPSIQDITNPRLSGIGVDEIIQEKITYPFENLAGI